MIINGFSKNKALGNFEISSSILSYAGCLPAAYSVLYQFVYPDQGGRKKDFTEFYREVCKRSFLDAYKEVTVFYKTLGFPMPGDIEEIYDNPEIDEHAIGKMAEIVVPVFIEQIMQEVPSRSSFDFLTFIPGKYAFQSMLQEMQNKSISEEQLWDILEESFWIPFKLHKIFLTAACLYCLPLYQWLGKDSLSKVLLRNVIVYYDYLDPLIASWDSGDVVSQAERGEMVIAAAKEGHRAVVQFLLSNGASITIEDRGMAFIEAAENGYIPLLQFLLSNDAEISVEDKEEAFICATKHSQLEVVQFLISILGSISSDSKGYACLYAAELGDLELFEWIVDLGDVLVQDLESALVRAAACGHFLIVDFLISRGFTLTQAILARAVIQSAAQGNVESMQYLLSKGAISIETRRQAREVAGVLGHEEVVEILSGE